MLHRMMLWQKKPIDDQDDVPPSVRPFETKALFVGAVVVAIIIAVVFWFVTGPPPYKSYIPQTDQAK